MPKEVNPAEFFIFFPFDCLFLYPAKSTPLALLNVSLLSCPKGGNPAKIFTFSPVKCVAALMPKGGNPAEFFFFILFDCFFS